MAMRLKKKDMQAAMASGAEVAVLTGYKGGTRGFPTGAARAIVVALDAERRVYRGDSMHGRPVKDGVRVRMVEGVARGARAGEEVVVAPADVLALWDDYETRQREYREAMDQREAKREANDTRSRTAAEALGGIGQGESVRLAVATAEDLAEALRLAREVLVAHLGDLAEGEDGDVDLLRQRLGVEPPKGGES